MIDEACNVKLYRHPGVRPARLHDVFPNDYCGLIQSIVAVHFLCWTKSS
jgi:hypothetical protein